MEIPYHSQARTCTHDGGLGTCGGAGATVREERGGGSMNSAQRRRDRYQEFLLVPKILPGIKNFFVGPSVCFLLRTLVICDRQSIKTFLQSIKHSSSRLESTSQFTALALNKPSSSSSSSCARCLCWARAPSGSATRQRVVPTDRHSFVVCQ